MFVKTRQAQKPPVFLHSLVLGHILRDAEALLTVILDGSVSSAASDLLAIPLSAPVGRGIGSSLQIEGFLHPDGG